MSAPVSEYRDACGLGSEFQALVGQWRPHLLSKPEQWPVFHPVDSCPAGLIGIS